MKKTTLKTSALLVSASLLSACSGSSSTPQPTPETIQAALTMPSSISAGSQFNVGVTLTELQQQHLIGAANSRQVSVIDIGSKTPKITCGAAQSVTVGNPTPTTFNCTAPAAQLSDIGTHQLVAHIEGQGLSGASKKNIDIQAIGSVEATVAPETANQGDTITITLTASDGGLGEYTVSIPALWNPSNSGICKIETANGTCDITATVPANQSQGVVEFAVTNKLTGSSALNNSTVSVNINNPPEPTSSKVTFDYETNIGETLYYNTSGSPTFTYKPEFVFTNTSGESVTIETVDINDTNYLTNVSYECNGTAQALPCTLAAGETFTVKGTLADFSAENNTKTLHISLKSGSDVIGQHGITTQFVKYLDGYVAVRSINYNKDKDALYLAAAYQGNTIKFALNDGLYVGATQAATNFEDDDFQFPNSSGGIVYIPYGISGTVYLSFDKFTTAPTPNPSAPNTPGFFTAEFTYLEQVPGAPAKCQQPGETCEQLVLDTTYVNYIQYFGSAATIGSTSYLPANTLTGYSYAGATPETIALGNTQVYTQIYNEYENFDAPWKYNPSATGFTDNYFATSVLNGSIPADTTILFAPIQLFSAGQATNTPMSNDYYNDYVDALWTYMETNPIYIDANSISNPAKTNCILKAEIVNGKLETTPIEGNDCQQYGYVVPAMVAQFNNCNGSDAPTVDGTNCADTPNLTFDKFTTCDFITAAGSASCGNETITQANFVDNETLWGPNGTYRAIVGRAITAYQSAGLLPICDGSGMTPISQANPMNQANSREAIATGNAYTNPSCLTELSASKPVYNLYSKEVSKYVQAYTYSYGDFLGMDATMTYSRNAFTGNDAENCTNEPNTQFCQLPRALPITLKIH